MAEPLEGALAQVRRRLLEPEGLVRAVASGRRRTEPRWRRVELRYVDLKAGRHLQVTAYDQTQAFTSNHPVGDLGLSEAVEGLLAEPFGNWHVESLRDDEVVTMQLRVTKKQQALIHESSAPAGETAAVGGAHDRSRTRLLAEDDPVFAALGLADSQGRIKPSRMAKYRQVEEFLRALDAALDAAYAAGALAPPTAERPLQVLDLGCGNAYLTFAAHRYLVGVRRLPVRVTGVDVKAQSVEHGTRLAAELGVGEEVVFVQGRIDRLDVGVVPDVVLALHACDTATDDALAQAVRCQAPLVLAAPCCHHDLAAQLRDRVAQGAVPDDLRSLLRDGILRERFADTLTDALRADALRSCGYRVDVVEFVDSRHTPRNTLLRAVRTGSPTDPSPQPAGLAPRLGLRPRLQELLACAEPTAQPSSPPSS